MKTLPLFSALVCASALFAEPVIEQSSFTVKQDATRNVVIRFTLQNEPAIITLQAFTNGVPLPGACVRTLSGDVCKRVETGSRTAYWNARRDMPDLKLVNGELAVKLTAWTLQTPPPYLMVDLLRANSLFYYPDADALPFGDLTNNIAYKRDYLVMRRIPAAGVRFRMGSPSNEANRITDGREDTRYVTLSEDYYMGVFEITEGQVATVRGSYWSGDHGADRAAYPQNGISYNAFRGSWEGDQVGWPEKGHAAAGVLAQFRSRTGLPGLDLPTAAQWEYACRAGNGGALNVDDTQATAADLAWYDANSDYQSHPVGQKRPNDWGLYDMLGNLEEYCLDIFKASDAYVKTYDSSTEYRDPIGLTGSRSRANRSTAGGHYGRVVGEMRCAFCTSWEDDVEGQQPLGYRLVCPIDPTAKGVPLLDADKTAE